jgi:tartrate dehydrogenase/decarboxylase/D-malate dehydrogenase
VAVLGGDGIGPEVTGEALRILRAVEALDTRIDLSFESFDWGSERYLRTGSMMPEDGIEELSRFDSILLGAVGDPRIPDHVTLWGLLLPIRQRFDQYVNLRPVRLLPGVPSVLSTVPREAIDMIFVRENTEGEYSGKGDFFFPEDPQREMAIGLSVFTRRGIERVVRYAFELGRRTGRSVTSISKGNALRHTAVLWDRVFEEVARDFPDVVSQSYLVDAAAMLFVRDPGRFGVVVASNLFGDILTDLGAAIAGGMGLAASANLDPTGTHPSMFEPVHGSAPDIAGEGLANPMASIWAATLMLEHLGHAEAARAVLQALEDTIRDGVTTRDLGGTAKTAEVGQAVERALRKA